MEHVCVCVCVQDQETSYTIIKSRETEQEVGGLKPSCMYVFQVRARTSAGYGAFSRRLEFDTSPYCEYHNVCVWGGVGAWAWI